MPTADHRASQRGGRTVAGQSLTAGIVPRSWAVVHFGEAGAFWGSESSAKELERHASDANSATQPRIPFGVKQRSRRRRKIQKKREGSAYRPIRVTRLCIALVARVRVVMSVRVGVTVAAKLSLPARTGPDMVLGAAARAEAAVLMMTPGPPVWTAMFVCSQSISLVVSRVQNGLVDDRRVAGSAVLFTNWSDV